MKNLMVSLSVLAVFVMTQSTVFGSNQLNQPYTGSEPDTLLLYHFDTPDQAASIPAGYPVDPCEFFNGDGFSTDGRFGGSYLSTFEGNGYTLSGTGAASLFSGSDAVKTIECWIKIDASAMPGGLFVTPQNEMQLCRFEGASGAGSHGGLMFNTNCI